jgi:acid phosphatase family membrane protein YuiD
MPRDVPGGSSSPPAGGLWGLFTNSAVLAAVLSCALAQALKVFTNYDGEEPLDWSKAFSSGGMPSSHTSLVVGLTTTIGLQSGTSSDLFALALIVTFVVAYDATGVRLHAGRQASVLNTIIAHLPDEHPAAGPGELRDSLGHTPQEVAAGAAVGFIVALLVHLI